MLHTAAPPLAAVIYTHPQGHARIMISDNGRLLAYALNRQADLPHVGLAVTDPGAVTDSWTSAAFRLRPSTADNHLVAVLCRIRDHLADRNPYAARAVLATSAYQHQTWETWPDPIRKELTMLLIDLTVNDSDTAHITQLARALATLRTRTAHQ